MTKHTVSCLRHADPHFLQVRVDFLAICDGNEAQAKILRILEAWTDFKISRGEPRWVSMSCHQFIEQSYSTLGKNLVYSALKALTKRGYIKRRRNPVDPFGSPGYQLNLLVIQQALDSHAHVLSLAKSDLEEERRNDETPEEGRESSEGVTEIGEGVTEIGEGVTEIGEGVTEIGEGVTEIGEGGDRNRQHTKNPNNQTKNPSYITKMGGFAAGGDDALMKERETETVTRLAAILRLPVTPELQRLVEEYSSIQDLSLLGEADDACAWIADPRRNRGRQPMTLSFFRGWIKRQVATLRKQEAEREQAKAAGVAQDPLQAKPSGAALRAVYPDISQLGPNYQEYRALMRRRAQAYKKDDRLL
jgi:hypothetical protein